MAKQLLLLLLATLAALWASCQSPKPHPTEQLSKQIRFAASGGGGLCSLQSTRAGWKAGVSVIWGHPLTSEGYIAADAKRMNLIYIVDGTPNAKLTLHTASYGQFNASWTDKGEVQGRSFTMSLQWNIQTEIVTAAQQQFNRTKGNVFVLLLEPNGEVTCQQLPLLAPDATCAELLWHVQRYCADRSFASSLWVDGEVEP